jgi:hypothetical protein
MKEILFFIHDSEVKSDCRSNWNSNLVCWNKGPPTEVQVKLFFLKKIHFGWKIRLCIRWACPKASHCEVATRATRGMMMIIIRASSSSSSAQDDDQWSSSSLSWLSKMIIIIKASSSSSSPQDDDHHQGMIIRGEVMWCRVALMALVARTSHCDTFGHATFVH